MSMTLIFWCSTSSVIITTHHTYFYDFSAGIRRKRRSQNTNRKEHLLMHSCKHLVMPTHIFDHVPFSSCFWTPFSAATARKSYGREVACVKINPKIVVVRTTLSSVLFIECYLINEWSNFILFKVSKWSKLYSAMRSFDTSCYSCTWAEAILWRRNMHNLFLVVKGELQQRYKPRGVTLDILLSWMEKWKWRRHKFITWVSWLYCWVWTPKSKITYLWSRIMLSCWVFSNSKRLETSNEFRWRCRVKLISCLLALFSLVGIFGENFELSF
jgi:hypothetical protein